MIDLETSKNEVISKMVSDEWVRINTTEGFELIKKLAETFEDLKLFFCFKFDSDGDCVGLFILASETGYMQEGYTEICKITCAAEFSLIIDKNEVFNKYASWLSELCVELFT